MWPSADLRQVIQFYCLCWMVDLWKKDVFLCPSLSHSFLDFCFHRVSSWCSLFMRSWSRDCSSWFISSEYPSLIASIFITSICCSILFFFPARYYQMILCSIFWHILLCVSIFVGIQTCRSLQSSGISPTIPSWDYGCLGVATKISQNERGDWWILWDSPTQGI